MMCILIDMAMLSRAIIYNLLQFVDNSVSMIFLQLCL